MDIVQKLRSQRTMSMFAKSEHLYEALNHDRREAADEIARLRGEIDNIKQVEFPRRVDKVADVWRNKCDLAESEITRLRDENEALASNLRGKHATAGATYAHLIAERDRLRDELTAARKTNSEWLAANGPGGWINDLRDENAKLLEDAERYRWLRQQNWNESTICAVARPRDAVKLGYDCPSMDRLDATIDAAMQKGE